MSNEREAFEAWWISSPKPVNACDLAEAAWYPAPTAIGERAALIEELRESARMVEADCNNGWLIDELNKAADMLAADADLYELMPMMIKTGEDHLAGILRLKELLAADAQEIADLRTQLARRTVERDMAIMAVCSEDQQVAASDSWPAKPLKQVQVTINGISQMATPERAYFSAWAMQENENAMKKTAQQVAVPQELSHDLLERLSWTLTDLGYAQPEGGVEQFGVHLEEHLFSICRGVSGLLAQARLAGPEINKMYGEIPKTDDVVVEPVRATEAHYGIKP